MNFSKLLFLILLIPVFFIISCPTEAAKDSNDPTYTLSGTATCTTSRVPSYPASGRNVYLKLVASGGLSTDTALYSTSAIFSDTFGSIATYSVSGIMAGNYTGWAFIDMDSSGSSAINSGDYATGTGAAISISGDTTFNLADNVWSKVP